MSTQPDPYKILGVAKDALLPEIRSAHRKLVLKCHPDKVQDPTLKAQKQDEFQRVQTAYELLADEKERKRYDDQARLAELREQMRAKTAASASSRQAAAAASPSASRPTPTSTAYKYEIHTPERSYKSPRQPSPGPRGYSSYSRSYEDDHHRAADIFEGVRTVRREKSYQDKTSRREEREREDREREKEYARKMREREKEKEIERQQRRKADEAIRRAEKEAKEAAKEARRAEKKTRDKSRKRETETKKTKPYIETFDGEPVSKSDKKKSSKKHDERRERDRSTHREEVVPPATNSMPPPPIPPQYSAEYMSKADAAMNYIQASRSKVPSSFARHVQPPAPTPPPVGSPFAAPAEDDDARRSSAKPRRNSAGEKLYSKPEVVDDPIEATPPTARPHMHKSATATGVPTSSPPRRDLPRTSTMPVEGGHSSRYAPGIARAQTFSGAYPELDPRGRGRTRHQAQIPESDSEDEYERQRRERKAHRSKKHGPETRGEHVMQYRVDGGRTTLQNSYSRSAEPTDAYGYYAEHTGARASERPSMPARDTSYSGGYGGVQYPKVKTSNYSDVQFSQYPSYREAYAA
jgi:curved DNA-binding protein CbpA